MDSPDDVCLVCMPFNNIHCPSLAMGTLKAILAQRSISCRDIYGSLEILNFCSPEEVQQIIQLDQHLVGDYVFADILSISPSQENDRETYFREISRRERKSMEELEPVFALIDRFRKDIVPRFFKHMLTAVDWSSYLLVGFTSTFQQHAASLAFAKILKSHFPDLSICFGGANVAGKMGKTWLAKCDFIDYVCTGEGDVALPELVDSLRAGRLPYNVCNIAFKKGGIVFSGPETASSVKLDSVPAPNFDSYFTAVERLCLRDHPIWQMHCLTIEGSRGCWWGAKHHCTFCGLNNESMAYRAKSPQVFLDELLELSRRYSCTSFQAVDNILDRKYLGTVLHSLAEAKSEIRLFFEIKSNVRLEELRVMRRAGIVAVQPGIESLNSEVLALMDKGVSGIQNVFLLKWAKYFGISVAWNLLCNFPGETELHYQQQAEWMPLLVHLDPPNARARVTLERFSPMYERQANYRVVDVRAHKYYSYVYRDYISALDDIAYFFEYRLEGELPDAAYASVDKQINHWKASQIRKPTLIYRWSPAGFVEIEDFRAEDHIERVVYKTPLAEAYELTSIKIHSATSLSASLAEVYGISLNVTTCAAILNRFEERGMAVREGDRFTALALPASSRFFESDKPARILPMATESVA